MESPKSFRTLLRVKFYNQFFIDRRGDVAPRGQDLNPPAKAFTIDLSPFWNPTSLGAIQGRDNPPHLPALLLNRHHIPGTDKIRGYSEPLPVNQNMAVPHQQDRKSTRLNSSHSQISYAVFCLK